MEFIMDKIINQMNEQGIIPCSDEELKEVDTLERDETEVSKYEQ